MNTNKANIVYKIGEVADMFGIHPDTLRNWEKDGVIVPERIGKRGDRRYTSEHIKKIQEEGLVTSIVKKTAGKNKDYSQYSKERLITELNKLKKQKKFGLVWEEKTEDVVEQCKKEAPILKHIKERTIKTDKDSPNNILIEGDNYHALQVLNYTHKGKIDVIYIDPPYNTGNEDWKYNDNIVDSTDEYRHSKWLSMMEKRLRLAKNLLSKSGAIFISINDNEQANLKLLCDDVLGEGNFIANLTWENREGGGGGDSVHFKIKHEYILVYAKKKEELIIKGVEIEDEKRYKLKDEHYQRRGMYQLIKLDSASIQQSESLKFNIKSPTKEMIVPRGCWRWSKEKVKWGIENDFIVIKKDRNNKWAVYSKQYLNVDNEDCLIKRDKRQIGVIENFSTTQSNRKMRELFGEVMFKYSKPVELISLLLKISTDKNSVVADFFAGSGTTGHAVLELNKADGGNRKFILCTNNDGNIAEEVTYPRIKKVIEGYKKNGNGEKVEGLGGNLEYLKTEFVNVDNINKVSDKKKLEFTHEVGEIIALKEDCFQEVIKNKHYQVFTDGKDKYVGIYFRENTEKLVELEGRVLDKDKDEVKLYIFSHSGGSDWENDYEEYKNVIVEDIPEPILKVYKNLNR